MITSDITIFKRNRTNPSSKEKDINNAGKIQTTNIPIQRKTVLFINFTTGKLVVSFNMKRRSIKAISEKNHKVI